MDQKGISNRILCYKTKTESGNICEEISKFF